MGLGVLVELSAAWQLAAPLSPSAARWILTLASIVLVVIALQDVRDVAGDRLRGRRTLPLVWGDQPLRRFLMGTFALLPVGSHWLLISSFPQTAARTGVEAFLAGICWIIAWRLWYRRGTQPDHRTYLLFTGWYCGLLASFAALSHFG